MLLAVIASARQIVARGRFKILASIDVGDVDCAAGFERDESIGHDRAGGNCPPVGQGIDHPSIEVYVPVAIVPPETMVDACTREQLRWGPKKSWVSKSPVVMSPSANSRSNCRLMSSS